MKILEKLEKKVIDVMERNGSTSIRELQAIFPNIPYAGITAVLKKLGNDNKIEKIFDYDYYFFVYPEFHFKLIET